METELKFLLSPEARARIERRAWPPGAGGESLTERQCTRYFDTADRALWKAGFTLRVRQAAGGYVQTVKSAGNRGAIRFCRRSATSMCRSTSRHGLW